MNGFTNLSYFTFDGNPLDSLDVGGCTSLTGNFIVDGNTGQPNSPNLSYLNVSGCTGITDLSCLDNQLTELDLTGLNNSINSMSFKDYLRSFFNIKSPSNLYFRAIFIYKCFPKKYFILHLFFDFLRNFGGSFLRQLGIKS